MTGSVLLAGGPRIVNLEGQPLRWKPGQPVPFAIDSGPLGSMDRQTAVELVRDAFQKWADVPTARISFAEQDFLELDINAENFTENQVRPDNPVVFDSDGGIIEAVFGLGASDTVLGFAAPTNFDSGGAELLSAWMVLNGRQASPTGFFPRVMVHEIGHFLGLDHTQANQDLFFNANPSDDVLVPVMFPFAVPNGPGAPIRDDVAWLSWMYPVDGFREGTGTITGQVLRRSGGPFQGANVAAVRIDPGTGEELPDQVVSVVSDFRLLGDGSFELPGLAPGDYALFIEPLRDSFVAGSGVWPFDVRFTDFAMKDYYNGNDESGDTSDDPLMKLTIPLAAGQTQGAVTMVANEPDRLLSQLTDDDSILFQFPEGFTFPFFGKAYSEVRVNSDGNLTFEAGDVASTARDAVRFLSGPPRIAPLFTDLNPERSGEVISSISEGRVRFDWQGVPEFSDSGIRPGNDFSVTLFSSGDLLFSYSVVDVTPDLPESENLQAVVGVSPGGAAQGVSVDFSASEGRVSLAADPVLEVFEGQDFDLAGQSVLLQSSSNELYFPFFRGDAEDFTGFALTNLTGSAAQVLVEGRNADGQLLRLVGGTPNPNNPASVQIEPGEQLAKLGREFLSVPLSTSQAGWLRMSSGTAGLNSFFQFGSSLLGPIAKLDGSLAFSAPSKTLIFTRIYQGADSFPTFGSAGAEDAETFLSFANPNDVAVTLTLNLFAVTGQAAAQPASRTIPPFGSLFETVASLFNTSQPISDGFVRVSVSGPGAVGFGLIELENAILGLNGSLGEQVSQLYSAQLATGTEGGNGVFTSLKLVNTSASPRAVTITAFDNNGSVLQFVGPFILNSNATFQRSVGALFGFGSPVNSPLRTGSIKVSMDAPGVVGDVIFGDPGDVSTGLPNQVDFAAALPLQTRLFTKAVFNQVVNGATDPNDPSTDTFTGITLFNPGSSTAKPTISVFDSRGMMVGTLSSQLAPNARLSGLVEDLIPQSAGQIGGYIRVESNLPMVGQVFFGNNTLQFLSAVPPNILE